MAHTIRLREPWRAAEIASPVGHLQTNLIESGDSCGWCFSRKFNSPTGLSSDQPVELTIAFDEAIRLLNVTLNGVVLTATVPPQDDRTHLVFDIREALRSFNQLELSFLGNDWATHPPKLIDHASVELRLG